MKGNGCFTEGEKVDERIHATKKKNICWDDVCNKSATHSNDQDWIDPEELLVINQFKRTFLYGRYSIVCMEKILVEHYPVHEYRCEQDLIHFGIEDVEVRKGNHNLPERM